MSDAWTLSNSFVVRLTFETDWHVGSGTGRPGNVDRLIARDSDGLPFVPAKTLRGIWRDACERLCRGLDNGQVGVWSRLVDQIFGSQPALGPNDPTRRHANPAEAPLESAVQIRAARIPSPLRERLLGEDRRLLRQALTFVKPGVMIDRRSGSAKTEYLRFEELGRKGTILEAECQLCVTDQVARQLASALLIASARLVERLGGKRRRGSGRCRLEILDAKTRKPIEGGEAVEWLKQASSPPDWSPAQASGAASSTRHSVSQGDAWVSVPLVLELQGPLAISYRTTGNVVETLDFLPGSYLLPHVTRTLGDLGVDIRSALQAGDVVILPAHPEVDGERGLPVPLAWFAPKGAPGLQDRAKVANRLLQPEPTDGTQLKQLRDGFVSAQPASIYKPPIIVGTHNTVEDQVQRPTEAVGGVYSYEAIAPSDQEMPVVLRSELRIRKSLADGLGADWWNRLNGQVSLGRSKKDDYGWVILKAGEPKAFVAQRTPRQDQLLFVWLVSDTLLRNAQLRPEPTAACLAEELSRRLGVTLKLRESAGNSGLLDELVRIRRLDTWHVGWGLPRPSLIALQAGSCMVFHVDDAIDPAKLAQLEAGGIGERTAEGYGQVRFNDPLVTKPPGEWSKGATAQVRRDQPKALGGQPVEGASRDFARLIERESWKQEIRRACLAIAADAKQRKELLGWVARGEQGQPPMSQLGGLRGQLAMLRKAQDRRQVLDWLKHLSGNKRRAEKWPSIPKVQAFIESDSRVWEVIETDHWPTLTANAKSELKQELWAFAVRTFFDACIRAHKRDLERQEVPHGA
jgi:CRISPR-associated protein Csx10